MRFLNTIDRPVQSWMTDRAFCFSLVLAILMVSDIAISPDDSEGVVLAKVMKTAKDIRSGDKKRVKTGVKTHIAAPAGCRAALWSVAAAGCLPGGGWAEVIRRRSAAVIRLYLISN